MIKNSVKANVPVFEEFNKLQKEIDLCNALISKLKTKRVPSFSLYFDIQDNLGEHLHKKLSAKIILLIEGEKLLLEEEQGQLRIRND